MVAQNSFGVCLFFGNKIFFKCFFLICLQRLKFMWNRQKSSLSKSLCTNFGIFYYFLAYPWTFVKICQKTSIDVFWRLWSFLEVFWQKLYIHGRPSAKEMSKVVQRRQKRLLFCMYFNCCRAFLLLFLKDYFNELF